jgi:hypothetical protein
MKFYKESTKINPLLFFETFINGDSLRKHEDQFYDYPINPSQENFRGQGYIQYIKEVYSEEEEYKPVKKIYIDELKRFLDSQVNYSFNLLRDRKELFDYEGKDHIPFTKKNLNIVYKIKDIIPEKYKHKVEILTSLNELENQIKHLLEPLKNSISQKSIIKSTQPYFEPIIRIKGLKKLYEIAIELDLIDDEIVSETDFLKVFMSNNPKALPNKIHFKANNQKVVYFIILLQKHFRQLTFSRIAKSEAFLRKTSIPFDQVILDTTSSRIKKLVDKEDFKKIKNSLDSL